MIVSDSSSGESAKHDVCYPALDEDEPLVANAFCTMRSNLRQHSFCADVLLISSKILRPRLFRDVVKLLFEYRSLGSRRVLDFFSSSIDKFLLSGSMTFHDFPDTPKSTYT
ncbi:hypothetical protein CY34DRAFT_371351 [Suillus luteus UH-Slu-Lm8-n1]|uniref:Uncharacterized protein n=1 Tax=Suillus luteus UH-Slu-Lm8-n1 TaxID=930992 RepID=A0A0D0AWL4_9AGAM|nr:hypothetical protein CY34DRAFT_371351 [Suillus luteus UH-Slu-Lm8-n1]